MITDETRPNSVGNEELVAPATEQETSERLAGMITTCKKIVPSLSTLALTFLVSNHTLIMNTVGGGHGGRNHG